MATNIKINNRIKRLSAVTLLIVANVAVCLMLGVNALLTSITDAGFNLLYWLELPPTFAGLSHRPWTLLTYMVTHYNVVHLLFNMLWLYWFGIILRDFTTERNFVWLYAICGVGGAAAYLATSTLVPIATAGLVGASASVFGIIAATAVRIPNYRLNLWLIGTVKIKWIALIIVGLMLLTTNPTNIGSLAAHVGGIVSGAACALASKPRWHTKANKCRATSPTIDRTEAERRLDELLKRVKKSGFASLSDRDKMRLIELSKKLK